MAQYSGINAVLESSQNDLRTMNSNRVAVFAASLQWADAVMVVSRGTPKSRTSVTWEIWWLVSAAEKDGERGGRLPTARHEHLLGLIGRSSDNEKQCYLQVNQDSSVTSLNLIN